MTASDYGRGRRDSVEEFVREIVVFLVSLEREPEGDVSHNYIQRTSHHALFQLQAPVAELERLDRVSR